MKEEFGKSVTSLLGSKRHFFEQNEELREKLYEQNRLYASQPERRECKNCNETLTDDGTVDFLKGGVKYVICSCCTHLNGANEDTEEFCKKIYTDDDGEQYAKNYEVAADDQYKARVEAIYSPKVEFLQRSLENIGVEPRSVSCCDLGAGSGYFVSALRRKGFLTAFGYDVSKAQVRLGNNFIGSEVLYNVSISELYSVCDNLKVDLVSLIGVLEHLQEPRTLLEHIQSNSNIKYAFLSVPLFSFSVFLEAAFPAIMPRQLAGAHTHLYTKESLEYLEKEYNLDPVAKWWFGTDMLDLYRSLAVTLVDDVETQKLAQPFSDYFETLIDNLQGCIDQTRQSSEVHVLYQIRR
jgi:hypothetical protein